MSSSSNSNPKMIVLVSSDGESFEIEEAVVSESNTIRHMIEDGCANNSIPLPNVTSKVLSKVIEFCKRRHLDTDSNDLKAFNTEFLKVDKTMLFDLIMAANYLDIKSLLDLTCEHVANMIKGNTIEKIREIFNITNDFTPEEEEEVRRENAWAFE